ncbi:hypothetical protein Ddye_028783 [Dipteronia dyeriana]|uniref:Thioredoxin domain-containing protein n=1 Tax=Dipteronia dyeriana TaxID=168575 RepID=A0AAD9WJZ7_9ROSI|nr:hypothetical protein Ddye_028783 [Dipteronia dyeriana]
MDDLFGMLGGSLRSSITDSTMMWIVHYAMDKAHGKVKSNGGVFQRLNEISKFYELAVIQLEGCMRFVQEEADGGSLETCHEKVLTDLTEIRDRLLGRLKESEQAILDKDRELLERLENELKLKQALELKERELVSLNDDNLNLGTEDRDGDEFCELMQSADQQVLNIKQQLHEPDCSHIDDNKKIEQMGFDIHILKETMDHAFGKMKDAIILSELQPLEKKWRWTIEKETIATSIKGFLIDFKENFEVEMRKQQSEKHVSIGLSDHMSHLIKEATCLRNELESLIDLSESQSKGSNLECRIPPRARSLSEGDSIADNLKIFSSKVDDEEPKKDSSHVAKMIKSHEPIIRRKSEELNWLKREILCEKECSSTSSRREMNTVSLRGRIQDVIIKLDNLIDFNSKLVQNFRDYGVDHPEEEVSMQESDAKYREDSGTNGLKDVWEKMNTASVSHAVDEQLHREIRMLKQEKENGNLLISIMEQTYATIFHGLMSEFYTELHARSLESLVKECTYEEIFKEMINERKEYVESNQIETLIREEVCYMVCGEMVKDFCSALDCTLIHCQDEYELREEVGTALFREMHEELNAGLHSYNTETLVREDISRIVLDEFIRDIVSKSEETKVTENVMYDSSISINSCEFSEYSVKEEVYMVFFRQVIDEWKMEIDACNIESLVREEMHWFILVETVKEISLRFMEADAQKLDKTFKNVLSADNTGGSLEGGEKESLIQNLDMRVKCFEELNEQLATSKSLLSELGCGLGTGVDDSERVHDQMTPTTDIVHDGKSCVCQQKYNAEFYTNRSDSIFTPILEFQKVFVNFETLAHKKLGNNLSRLKGLKHQLDSLIELVVSIQKRELLYKEAFIRRCQNLQKAETEVDLLGDQVDVLLSLLEKIYWTLHQYSPLLQQHFEVSEILKLIQKELTEEPSDPPIFPSNPDKLSDTRNNVFDEKDVVELSDQNFSHFVAKNRYVMVAFYAPRCYWSKKLAPEYAAAATQMKGSEVVLAKVDATREIRLANKYGVQGYPSLNFFVGGVDLERNYYHRDM